MGMLGSGVIGGGISPLRLSPDLYYQSEEGCWEDSGIQFTAADCSWLAMDTPFDPGTSDFSVAFWIYPDTTTTYQAIVDTGGMSADPGFSISTRAGRDLGLWIDTGSRDYDVDALDDLLTTGEWHFIVVNWDRDGNAQVYHNGEAAGTPLDITGHQSSLGATRGVVGATAETGNERNFLDGRLDSLGLWTRLLTRDEITALYNSGAGLVYGDLSDAFKTDLSHWYGFLESTGTRYDSHGSNDLAFNSIDIVDGTTLNGGFEDWTSGTDADDWAESVGGTSTVNRESSVVDSGTYALRMDIDAVGANGSYALVRQLFTPNKLYNYTVKAKADSGTPAFTVYGDDSNSHTLDTTYTEYSGTVRATAGGSINISRSTNSASKSLYFDAVAISAAEMLAVAGIAQGEAVDADPVSYWEDQAANNKNASQTTISKRPTYEWDGITADGVDDYMDVGATTEAAGFLFSAVLKVDSTAVDFTVVGGDGDNNYIKLTNNTTITVRIAGGSATAFTVAALGTDAHVITVTRDASDDVRVYVDGTESSTGEVNLSGTLTIDQLFAHDSEYFEGSLAALFLSDEKTGAQVAGLERYFAVKYGITLS